MSTQGHHFFLHGCIPDSYPYFAGIQFTTDFRAWLKYEYVQNCINLLPKEKVMLLLKECIKTYPDDCSEPIMIDAMIWFHSCADVERLTRIKIPKISPKDSEPKISLYWDFYQLWCSFRQQYEIDLYECGYMHWWEFRRLLGALKPDTPLMELQNLRGMTKDVFLQKKNKLGENDWGPVEYEKRIRALPEQD